VHFVDERVEVFVRCSRTTISLVLLNAVVVAPLVEESALRGFFLTCLESSGYAINNLSHAFLA
jgi:hypothetical protein